MFWYIFHTNGILPIHFTMPLCVHTTAYAPYWPMYVPEIKMWDYNTWKSYWKSINTKIVVSKKGYSHMLQQGLDLPWLQRCLKSYQYIFLVWLLIHLENDFISHTLIKKRIHSLPRISWTDVSVQFCPWSHDWRSEEWMENKLHVSFTS